MSATPAFQAGLSREGTLPWPGQVLPPEAASASHVAPLQEQGPGPQEEDRATVTSASWGFGAQRRHLPESQPLLP